MIDHLLNKTALHFRPSPISDGAGGQDVTRVQIGTVQVKVDQPSHAERTTAEQSESWQDNAIYTVAGSDVRRGDELQVEGRTYRVDGTFEPSRPAYLRLDCVLLQGEGAGGG